MGLSTRSALLFCFSEICPNSIRFCIKVIVPPIRLRRQPNITSTNDRHVTRTGRVHIRVINVTELAALPAAPYASLLQKVESPGRQRQDLLSLAPRPLILILTLVLSSTYVCAPDYHKNVMIINRRGNRYIYFKESVIQS